MNRPIDNQHVIEIKALPSPRAIKTKLPITDEAAALVVETREAIRRILHGQDRERLLVIVGPCSIHDPEAAYEYASRLKPLADAVRDRLLIVMRTYFEKPRTTVGWKGLINDPHLDGTCDIATGMELARTILLKINQIGMPCATELLDPISPQYIADLVSWTAIGARTTESQTHREMASGVSMPVGFKNGTEGSLHVAVNAMTSARTPHHFVGINADGQTSIIKTMGNPDRHIVLRGGGGKTNYEEEHVAKAEAAVSGEGIARSIMIDCSQLLQRPHAPRSGGQGSAPAIPGRPSLDHGPDARKQSQSRQTNLETGRRAFPWRLYHRRLSRLEGHRGVVERIGRKHRDPTCLTDFTISSEAAL
jgi:3-deoxy-7-phosphoheptulonate synthase